MPATALTHAILAGEAGCTQPPSGIDLSTLSDVNLAYYGLEPRPEDAKMVGAWRSRLAQLHHRICGGRTVTGIHYGENDGPSWAGYNSAGGGYQQASADWHIPSVDPNKTGSCVAEWVGLDGNFNGGNDIIVQAGFTTFVSCRNTQGVWAWIEDYPNDPYYTNLFALAGDHVFAEVDSNHSWAGHNRYFLDNLSTGTYTSPSTGGDSDYLTNGSTAEWIVEKVGDTGLATFSTVTFNSAYSVRNGSGTYVGSTPNNSIVMWHCPGGFCHVPGDYKLAYPGSIQSGSWFNVYYNATS